MSSISLRSELQGVIVEFLKQEKMSCLITQEGILSLINALSLYKEEGKLLFPEIFIIDDLEKLKYELKPFIYHFIDESDKTPETMFTALKKCAPLTEGGAWSIYILRKETKVEYGIFSYGEHLLSVDAKKILLENDDYAKIIHIQQLTEKTVMLSGSKSEPLTVNFGINPTGDLSFIKNQIDLIYSILTNLKAVNKDPSVNFLNRVLTSVLQKSHGILIAVIDSKKKVVPKFLSDGITKIEKISIEKYVEDLLNTKTLSANYSIEGCASIISGMLLSDGITIFDNSGSIRAYNVFVKIPKKENIKTSGGARERTFEFLCSKINKGIISAFMQSQDGKTKFEGKL